MRPPIPHSVTILFVACILLMLGAMPARAQSDAATRAIAAAGFIENGGQWSARARFRAQSGGLSLWLADDAAWIELAAGLRGHALRQRFVDGRARAIAPAGPAAPWSFIGGSRTLTARSFASVTYRDLYPGIDARYHRDGGSLKYDLVVAPGAALERVRISYDGAERLAIAPDGSLRIMTSVGELRESPPVSWQLVDGRRIPVASRFVLDDRGVGFAVGRHDRRHPLVIDPSLAFSTFIGGGAADSGRGLALDAAANVYVGGTTHSSDIPTSTGALFPQPDRGNSLDMFVVKLDPTMSVVLYGTYLGGRGADELAAIQVRSDSAIVLAGTTASDDFPVTPLAEQRTLRGSSDGFVTIIHPDGRTLLASTYFGGSSVDRIEDLAISTPREGEQPFVVGSTFSDDLPRTDGSALGAHRGGWDAFVARFAADLSGNPAARRYATYLGGAGDDLATGIALAPGGAANVTGSTTSDDFPTTPGAGQPAYAGGGDGFISRIRFNGSLIEYSTYLGGSSVDRPLDIALDALNNPYVVGLTFSTNLPVSTPDAPGTWFAARVDSLTGSFSFGGGYCRYVGPVHDGAAWTVQANAAGEAFIAGSATGTLFPTTSDSIARGPGGGHDLALVRLSSDGATIVHSSIIGGEGDDVPWRQSRLTRFDDLYVTGRTVSARFPTTPNAFDQILNTNASTSRSDAFALAFRFAARPTIQSPVRVLFDTVRCDTVARDTFEVANAGDAELVIRRNIFARASGRFVLESPDPANTDIRIAPGGSIRYIVRFRAPQPDTVLDTLLIFSNDSLRDPLRVALLGVRSSPAFQGLAPSYTLPAVEGCPGATSSRAIIFANSGTEAALVTAARLSRAREFSLVGPATLPITIGVGDDAPFTVRFRPTAAGTYRDTLVVSVSGCPTPVRVEVVATADSVGLDIVESAVQFPALASCVGAIDTTITLRATGTREVMVVLESAPGAGFSVNAPMPVRVPAGRSVAVPVRFAPAAGPVTASAVLRLRTQDTCARVDSVVLSGERRPGAALQAPDTVRFGTRLFCAGEGDTLVEVEILNRSATPVTLGAPAAVAPFTLENAGDFPTTIAAGASIIARVRFVAAGEGVVTDALALPIDAGGCRDTLRIPMSAAAVRPIVAPLDTAIDVGTLPDCVGADTVTIALRNLSPVPVVIDSLAEGAGLTLLAPASGFELAPMESRTVWLRFAPQRTGLSSERLVLYTAGCRDSIVVRVTGTKEGSVVVASPSSIELAPELSCAIGTSRRVRARIENRGGAPVQVRSAGIGGDAAFALVGDPSGTTIAAGGSLEVEIDFTPGAAGTYAAALELLVDPCSAPLVVPLRGSVVAAALAVSTVDFGSVDVGSSASADLVVVNELPVAVRIERIGPPPAPFAFVAPPPVPATLAPGETLRVAMRFDPSVAGSYAPTMEIAVDSSCAFATIVQLAGRAEARTDTIEACIEGSEAGLAGEIVELTVTTDPHAPLGPGSSVVYAIAYDWRSLEFVDAPGATTVGAIGSDGVLRLRVSDPAFGANHLRLRFRLLSGGDGAASVRLDSSIVEGDALRLEPCADSAVVRVADRCVLTGVALGRFANRLETTRPNPARGAVAIDFSQLEDTRSLLTIHDLGGRELVRAVDETLPGGRYSVRVDLGGLAAGTYLVRIVAGSFVATTTMLVE